VTRRSVLLIITANLLALVALAFAYPQLMVAPGALMPAHAALTNDCFACHAPLRGVTAERCASCHVAAEIGLRNTKGAPLAKPLPKAAFHRDLIEKDCAACHTDHEGPKLTLTHGSRKPFSHALLLVATRERCESCHAAPKTALHRDLDPALACSQCHRTEAWKPAAFKHELLAKAVLDRCETCHKPPTDTLHRQISGNCAQCHTPTKWTPATFDHAKYFVLDGDHNTTCVTCHLNGDYRRYTCYGCHEHTPERIRSKHQKEGIRNFENCIECHRSADEREGRGERGERGGRREKD
jgi:hypothetical protein